ncbi:hypothetical protein FVE67_01915 [Thermosulfurimonas marina]|uniref:Type 4 fimbrial biogenesis protein PilX N-terminal domain-containing protein n=1 Tax=Thermosulfurimonas marina TaxID=2047767 RepID=A0A6H1WR33_9BACT|nr:hypothetical protein [Thermosulfurimonas marina]QJA05628.1 hypothetical protein FVE67_01915 [Thermosulfurimonas marina]
MKGARSRFQGFALIWVLVFMLVGLILAYALVALLTQGQRVTGFLGRYHSVLEATQGVLDLSSQQMFDLLFYRYYSGVTDDWNQLVQSLNSTGVILNQLSSDTCLKHRLGLLDNATNCPLFTVNPPSLTDIETKADFSIQMDPYQIYFLIANRKKGNTDISGNDLITGGVAQRATGMITVKSIPYLYQLEIYGRSSEKAHLSALYLY